MAISGILILNFLISDSLDILVHICMVNSSNLLRCVWGIMSWQQLGSHQDGYRLMTVCTHGDFIVLPDWKTRLLTR